VNGSGIVLYYHLQQQAMNVMVEWLALLFRIQEVLGLHLGPETYHD
jgi:hypothetical protein